MVKNFNLNYGKSRKVNQRDVKIKKTSYKTFKWQGKLQTQ